MIALKDDLPLVVFEQGDVMLFERTWLVRVLAIAAQRAGYHKWWLAEHVAESVTIYLTLKSQGTTMPVQRLVEAVRSVLQVIGYGEVAQHFSPGPPPARVSLPEMARQAGAGYELAFFDMLGRRLQDLIASRTDYLELSGLERCVKQLRSKKVWSRDCDALRHEIVCFVREQLGTSGRGGELTLTLS